MWLQGNCSANPPAELLASLSDTVLEPLLPGQCLLVTDGDLFDIMENDLWLDSVYIRLKRTNRDSLPSFVYVDANGALFMTAVTLQGDDSATGQCGALTVHSRVFAKGAHRPFVFLVEVSGFKFSTLQYFVDIIIILVLLLPQ
jgi:hypothetical protein